MEDIFKPSSLSIKQLFGNTDALYQIPRYQRPYSWGDEQLEKLWYDLLEAQENDPNYFLGSIITAKPEESSSYLDIVDGQQRLTTLTILLCVFRDLYPEINNNILDEDPFAVDIKIVNSSIKFNDRFQRLRLRTHSNHQSEFENLILNGNTLECNNKPTKKDLKKEEDPKFKFKNTVHFFIQKLTELGNEKSGLLLNYIFNNVKVIRIDCQSVSFAIKLFQVLNNRGLELSNSDLIKSFLISKIQKKYDSDNELRKQKEDQFIDDWKRCETYANHTETSMNEFFVIYEYYLLAQNPKKSLYDELVNKLNDKDPNEVMANLEKFINNYKELFDKNDKIIYSFRYLQWGMYWKAILLTALTEDYLEYNKFSKLLRRFYYLNWIAGYTLTKIKQISFNLIKWLKENKSISEIENELENNLNQNNTIQRAIENLCGDIYFDSWCKPLLFMIEYAQTDDSNLNFLPILDKKIHIEHILPKAYEENDDWNMFHNDTNIHKWINTAGNLTLLSGEKNISASNEGFDKKIIAYNGKGNYLTNKEGITAFRITQNIANDYYSGKYDKKWTWNSIYDRWNWFCEQVENILEIDLSKVKK